MIEKQFDIPILTPLLACYDIPAPIIYPPGVDPRSFLIKKPHCDQKIEIMSPMDIDPCVVSRSECVARTYDLTASEHAGVYLSQPLPMVATTSNSPAHSETTTQQRPDNKKNQDVLQKEALAVVDSLFVCSIPDPGCDYQKIVTEDQMTTPMCMDPTSMTKTNVSQLLWCKICKVSCSSEQCLEKHMSGKPHLKALKLSEQIQAIQASQTSMDMTPIEMPLDDLKPIKCETVNMDGNNKPTRCEVCNVNCTSRKDLKRHSSGKKHLKNLQKLGKVPELPSTPSPLVNMTSVNPKEGNSTQCELCGVSCTSIQELNKHLAGQKHKKIVRNSQMLKRHSPAPAADKTSLEDLMNEDMEEGEILTGDGIKRKANGSLASNDNVDTKRQKVTEDVMDSGELVTCRLCDVASNGLMAYQNHLISPEHSAMVMKQVNGGSSKQQVY